jgi:tRNA threonylcarbamoyladenosine biosynthesis protein TsaE
MKTISNSTEDTLRIGRTIAKSLKKGDIICLFGQLGSGKTVLAKGIAAGLGIKKKLIISPTFVLIREYLNARFPFYHVDLYRLKKAQDIFTLGYEEYLDGNGILLIEWADRLKGYLPSEYLKIEIIIKNKKSRIFKLSGFGRRYKEILKELLQAFM